MGRAIYSNRYNLPDTLVRAVIQDDHKTEGTLSVTTLIDAPQIRILKRDNDYVVDVSSQLYALLGTALHTVLEKSDAAYSQKKAFLLTAETLIKKAREFEGSQPDQANNLKQVANYLFELVFVLFPDTADRYIYEITTSLDIGEGYILSGTFDLYDRKTGILYDYKFCSTFQYTYPESRQKWEEQVNIYAYMLIMKHNLPVNAIRIVAFFRDWSTFGQFKDKNYPERQTLEVPISIRPIEKVVQLITKHRDRHLAADRGENVECTGKERWASASEYAVMQAGGKRAKSKHPSPELAQRWIEENKHKIPNLYIDSRPGVSKRCENFCPVSSICPQYKKEIDFLKNEEITDEKEKIEDQTNPFVNRTRGLR